MNDSCRVPDPTLGRRTLDGGFWSSVQAVVTKVASLVASVALARLLEPVDYACADIATRIAGALIVLSPLVMSDVLVARGSFASAGDRAGLRIGWISGLSMSMLMLIALPVVRWTHYAMVVPVLALYAVRPLVEAMSVGPLTSLRRRLEFRRLAWIDGCSSIAGIAVGLSVAWLGGGAFAIVASPVLAAACRAVLLRAMAVPETAGHDKDAPSRSGISRDFVVLATGQWLHLILVTLDVLVLGWICSGQVVGYYSFAATLALQAHAILILQLTAVLQPAMAMMGTDVARRGEAVLRIARALACVIVPVGLAQAAFCEPVIRLVFSEKWIPCVPMFMVMSLNMATTYAAAPVIAGLKAGGRFGVFMVWQLLQLLACGAGFLLLPSAVCSAEVWTTLDIPEPIRTPVVVTLVNWGGWLVALPVVAWLGGLLEDPWRFLARIGLFSTLARSALALVPFVALMRMLPQSVDRRTGDVIVLALLAPIACCLAAAWNAACNPDLRPMLTRLIERLRRRPASS